VRNLGTGEKVFDAPPVRGRLAILDGPQQVLELLDGGADGVIALVRDAGATFLAPLLHELTGVICTGGTLRSHIGLVTREFRVPCVMGATFDEPVADGIDVELDCSGPVGVIRG
jgi:signal transduction protein with GAF and PtsI domain